jgi:hypothetical protein
VAGKRLGDLPPEVSQRSVALLADEVMPAFPDT